MVIEAGVFRREHGVLHDLRDRRDGREVAALLTELADLDAFCREHPQRQLGAIVRELGDVRQVGIGDRQRDRDDAHDRDRAGSGDPEAPQNRARKPLEPCGLFGGRGFGLPFGARCIGH